MYIRVCARARVRTNVLAPTRVHAGSICKDVAESVIYSSRPSHWKRQVPAGLFIKNDALFDGLISLDGYQLFFIYIQHAVLAQQCFSRPGCTGGVVAAPGPSAIDCCSGTEDGQSYGSPGACDIPQCIGIYTFTNYHFPTLVDGNAIWSIQASSLGEWDQGKRSWLRGCHLFLCR